MRDLAVLFIDLIVTLAKLLRPGGINAVIAETLVLKQQLQVSNRTRLRAPNLTTLDRILFGLGINLSSLMTKISDSNRAERKAG